MMPIIKLMVSQCPPKIDVLQDFRIWKPMHIRYPICTIVVNLYANLHFVCLELKMKKDRITQNRHYENELEATPFKYVF